MCNISGEISESQKQELEQYQATVKRQESELVEVRQQLAKLSEIVDRQTDDMKQLNVEARFAASVMSRSENSMHQLIVHRLKQTRCSYLVDKVI